MAAMEEVAREVDTVIASFPDFPKPGILFRDIMPLFAKPQLVAKVCAVIADHVRTSLPQGVTAVAGLEARGFLFGPQVAMLLAVPFVPIRKQGKLPGATIQASYVKEYGTDTVEVQKGVLGPQDRVLILDDLLATGGTLRAAIELVHKTGAVVAESFVLIELADLKGRDVLPKDSGVHALLRY